MSDDIILFSASWCSSCNSVKDFLNKKGVKFEIVDIDTVNGMNLAIEHDVKSLPVAIIDDTKIIGSKLIIDYMRVKLGGGHE